MLLFFAAGGAVAWYSIRGGLPASLKVLAPMRGDKPVPAATKVALPRNAAAPVVSSTPPVAAVVKAAPRPVPAAESGAAVRFQAPDSYPRSPTSWMEAQVALARRGFSCGSIDGVGGAQTVAAWQAFQSQEGLPETRWLDPRTCAALPLDAPATTKYTVTAADLARLQPISSTWLEKSEQTALDFETLLELVAERTRAHPNLLKKLNPDLDWADAKAGAVVVVPTAARTTPRAKAAALHVQLEAHTLQAYDADGRMIAHFPVSIAKKVEKRPVGELHVTVVIRDPNYTFDPDVFPESAEGRELGRKLVVPPGPNNPVGVAWVGLDLAGYGIHGTPNPEQVGRTESHGCFRLANWDARTLLDLAWVGLPVYVDP
jgi:lipoprotein-anchoring transpeptidase ErfK/SrfK